MCEILVVNINDLISCVNLYHNFHDLKRDKITNQTYFIFLYCVILWCAVLDSNECFFIYLSDFACVSFLCVCVCVCVRVLLCLDIPIIKNV